MTAVPMWLRIGLSRRWRSLIVLAMLVALVGLRPGADAKALVLVLLGLLDGVPPGLSADRLLWRLVATDTPAQYMPSSPWPGTAARRFRLADVLRTQ